MKALEARWVDALQKGDTARLEAVVATDYTDTDEGGRPLIAAES